MYVVKIPGTKVSRVQVQEPKTPINARRDANANAPWVPAEIRGEREMKLFFSLCQLARRCDAFQFVWKAVECVQQVECREQSRKMRNPHFFQSRKPRNVTVALKIN